MRCPFCNHSSLKVTDSRDALDINGIRRRRECLHCARRFTTFETIEAGLQVQKRDGRYEEFQEAKLIQGVTACCHNTGMSAAQIQALSAKIANELLERPGRIVSSKEIGSLVMESLKRENPVAYIRFACVYHQFKDMKELMAAINSIIPKDDQVTVESGLKI